jgi:hypothetical protein
LPYTFYAQTNTIKNRNCSGPFKVSGYYVFIYFENEINKLIKKNISFQVSTGYDKIAVVPPIDDSTFLTFVGKVPYNYIQLLDCWLPALSLVDFNIKDFEITPGYGVQNKTKLMPVIQLQFFIDGSGDQNNFDNLTEEALKSTHFLKNEEGGILPLMYNSLSAKGYDQRVLTQQDLKGLNIQNSTIYGNKAKSGRIGGQNTNSIPYEPR